ncbi:hypothetical protein ACXATD_002469 [Clostridium sporogenes]
MDKDSFRKTEKKLYNYFRKDKKISSLNKKINLLRDQINDIDQRLRNVDIDIPEESKSIAYEERVQTSSDGSSYAERTLMRITDRLLIEKSRKTEEIANLEEQIRQIVADNVIIEDNIKDIRGEEREFLRLKYGEEMKDWQVGNKLGMSQPTSTRTRQRLVENVARWETWQKSELKMN